MSSKYHIIYPRGDRTRLVVVEISDLSTYELSDYAVASRQSFADRTEAQNYANHLARKHRLATATAYLD